MTRRLLALLLTTAFAAAPAALTAQLSTHLTLAGGVSVPSGNLKQIADAGYNLAAGLDIGAPLVPIGVRLEGGYNGFNLKGTGGGTARAISGTVNAVLALGPTGASPYLIGGVGIYNSNAPSTIFVSSGKTVGGVNVGAGLRFPLGIISTFVEARYHQMLGNATDGSDWKFIPITFGVSF